MQAAATCPVSDPGIRCPLRCSVLLLDGVAQDCRAGFPGLTLDSACARATLNAPRAVGRAAS